MADFVAVLRKTVGALGDNSPEMREKIFDKARATIEAKLAAIDPPPPAAVADRQRKALEDAIAVVRADYARPAPEADDSLESVFSTLDQPGTASQATSAPENAPDEDAPDAGIVPDGPEVPRAAAYEPPAAKDTASRGGGSSGRSRGRIVATLAVLLLLAAAGGYAWWSGSAGSALPQEEAQAPAADDAGEPQAAATAEDLAQEPEQEQAALTAEETAAEQEPAEPAPAPAAAAEKFTQRLLPDGNEVDEGPAGGEPGIGEGSSVAAVAQPAGTPDAASGEPDAAETGAQAPAGQAAAQQQPQEQPAPAAVTVGQRAIFYEERTSAAEGSAEMGSIAWSLVQESPGGDLPPEPAIRAEATIPAKDVQLRMTIRRNGDRTLPASHIVEMIFLTPDGFEGGTITNVSRIAFKDTEQAPGSPLIGIPAKIADGFFLIALSDAPAETQNNLNLLRRESWLDIPIVYQSGRRALLSLEKGIPGDRVFQDALRAWTEADSG